jgi:hypothetical protein
MPSGNDPGKLCRDYRRRRGWMDSDAQSSDGQDCRAVLCGLMELGDEGTAKERFFIYCALRQ